MIPLLKGEDQLIVTGEIRTVIDLKRFVLMFYPDLTREIIAGWGEKLEMLRRMMGHQSQAAFLQLCKRELEGGRGPGFFAETMIMARSNAHHDMR